MPHIDGQKNRVRERGGCGGGSLAGAVAAPGVAVKVVIEAGWRAAVRVTAAVVEEPPALQRLTLPPGVVHAQRAVTAVPAAAWAVALAVAVLVPSLGLAGRSRAPWLLGDLGGCGRGLATQATPARSADAAEERDVLYSEAGAPVQTRGSGTAGVSSS